MLRYIKQSKCTNKSENKRIYLVTFTNRQNTGLVLYYPRQIHTRSHDTTKKHLVIVCEQFSVNLHNKQNKDLCKLPIEMYLEKTYNDYSRKDKSSEDTSDRSPTAEANDLKSLQFGFESRGSHQVMLYDSFRKWFVVCISFWDFGV